MFYSRIVVASAVALIAGPCLAAPRSGAAATAPSQATAPRASRDAGALSRRIWVRIVPMWGKGWPLKDRTGQDIIDMIAKVKPDVLERLVQSRPQPELQIPMGAGRAPLTLSGFLNAAVKAGAPGAFITPKVHQNDIISDEERIAQAQAWYDFKVSPRMKYLSLDVRPGHGTPADHKALLERFKAMGWNLGFNFAGGGQEVFGLGTYAQAAISKVTWEVSQRELADMTAQGITVRLGHIDYPPGITTFGALPADRQAEIILKLREDQYRYGFTFVYPVFYGRQGYDSSRQTTSSDGPFGGVSVLDVIAEAVRCDRLHPKPCTPRFPRAAATK